MPLKKCQENNKPGWKWGNSKKCFTGPGAKEKARKMGVAIELNKKRQGKKSEFATLAKELTKEELMNIMREEDISLITQAQVLMELKS